jgi:hypothetical protein
METSWIFHEPIDFEHKQYVLLAYLQKIKKNLNNLKLYPNFQQISLHLANINLVIEKGQYVTLNRQIKEPDDEILITDLVPLNVPIFSKEELDELFKICLFSSEKLKDEFNQAKAIWEIANDSISIEVIQNKNATSKKQGLFYIEYDDKFTLYEFIIKPIKKNSVETKNLIKKICVSEDNTFEGCFADIKKPLIKNLEDKDVHKNLILFKVVHTNQFPLRETLLPIAKRKVMNYINQSKFIEVNNLTKKI